MNTSFYGVFEHFFFLAGLSLSLLVLLSGDCRVVSFAVNGKLMWFGLLAQVVWYILFRL